MKLKDTDVFLTNSVAIWRQMIVATGLALN
jgi:hypothetical protein